MPITQGSRVHAAFQRRVTSDPRADRQERQHRRDRPLREEADRETAEERSRGACALPVRSGDRDPEAGHRKRRSQRERGIGHHSPAGDEHERDGGEERERPQRVIAAIAQVSEPRDGHAACEQEQERRKAGRELADADRHHRRRRQPRGQRRLAPEGHSVSELRHEPLAGFDHLARDLGIACFGRVRERVRTERCQTHGEHGDDEQREDAALARRQAEGHVPGHASAAGGAASGRDGGSRRCTR